MGYLTLVVRGGGGVVLVFCALLATQVSAASTSTFYSLTGDGYMRTAPNGYNSASWAQ